MKQSVTEVARAALSLLLRVSFQSDDASALAAFRRSTAFDDDVTER